MLTAVTRTGKQGKLSLMLWAGGKLAAFPSSLHGVRVGGGVGGGEGGPNLLVSETWVYNRILFFPSSSCLSFLPLITLDLEGPRAVHRA